MTLIYLSQLNTEKKDDKKSEPKKDDTPISTSEKLVREDIKKLTENAEELRKLREQIEKKKDKEDKQ
jgi:hypothetical protein